jgi:hypothetical protein
MAIPEGVVEHSLQFLDNRFKNRDWYASAREHVLLASRDAAPFVLDQREQNNAGYRQVQTKRLMHFTTLGPSNVRRAPRSHYQLDILRSGHLFHLAT